ncbi:MAG TPA: SDR family oxidoreductase [Caulobacter sp.]|nr:SDR family oxidoreductase [Caulobacter sp.]
MPQLTDKVALVTGASSGIGLAIARLFAAEGARVVLSGRRAGPLEAAAEDIRQAGGEAAVIAGDVAEEHVARALVEEALRRFGGLDVAVNNAGTAGPAAPLAETSLEDWRRVIDVNLTGAFLGARHQIPAMLRRGGGAIVFISSFVGTSVGIPGMGAYGASKAGLMGLVKGIAADYGAAGIRSNALLPGGVDTPMAGDAAQKQWAAGLHAMKRIARPEEIADAALFLAGPMSSFVTGSALYADGGNAAVK